MTNGSNEQSPLLQSQSQDDDSRQVVEFSKSDEENPRNWSRRRKYANVAIISLMALISPLASSMFTPGIQQISDDLNVGPNFVIGATTSFVLTLGFGPLILAPLSETFGRRKLYLVCFSLFSLLQIPTALSPNVETLITLRTFSGFLGSVAIANGGGSINDMFHPSARAKILGIYILSPILGPSLGPLFGGIVVQFLGWRWVFWVLAIFCTLNTTIAFFFLKESYAPTILEKRKDSLEKSTGDRYYVANEDSRPIWTKLAFSMSRPLRILFTQPIIFIMAVYQACIFGTNYSLYTNFQAIYGNGYGFSTIQVGVAYLASGVGFVLAVWLVIPRIDTIYNSLTARNNDVPKPEFRLPLANIGSVFIPLSLFWLAWTVEYHVHWSVTILSTVFLGFGQIIVFNTAQNYFIDSFSQYAASAIAAGAVFRSVMGGLLPLAAPSLFEGVGYGWGISIFAFLNLAISPFPLLFYLYGEPIRMKFAIEL